MSKESMALVAYGPISRGQWKMQPVTPRSIRSDEISVRLIASGICRADIHFGDAAPEGNSNTGIFYPRVLGHEGSGFVKEVGSAVTTMKRNDPVILSFASCGECYSCDDGHPAYCANGFEHNFVGEREMYSTSQNGIFDIAASFFGQSSFARTAIVKARSVVNVAGLGVTSEDLKVLAPLGPLLCVVVEQSSPSTKSPQHRAFAAETIFERDVEIPMTDGVMLRGDVFRPSDITCKVPAIIAWSPYGKTGAGPLDLNIVPGRVVVAQSVLSGYESWEAPDPAEWIARGYAIVNIDNRGTYGSDGDIRFWGTSEGRDGYDAIEHIAQLPWCNGKTSLCGNSWLAVAQWFIAAERPPHLSCIAPLEGASDIYREIICRGGVPCKPFFEFMAKQAFYGTTSLTLDHIVNKAFPDWPIKDTEYRTLYLSQNREMSEDPSDEAIFSYQSDAPAMQADEDTDELYFTYTFKEPTSFLGYSKAILYMSCQDHDDLDVFVQLRKADKNGKILQNLNIPLEELGLKLEDVETINTMKYLGPSGILRASHREVDMELSKPNRPFHPHKSEQRVPPGTVAKLEIGLWPSGMLFDAGESIVLKVSGHHMTLAEFIPQRGQFVAGNKGEHHLHVGGNYSSCIVIPLLE
ncbi:hypothetical protein N7488_005624 [Penicillium malachiteum]|nr:hypothetical protein N7488_005624 [Penicillium malachiteum]